MTLVIDSDPSNSSYNDAQYPLFVTLLPLARCHQPHNFIVYCREQPAFQREATYRYKLSLYHSSLFCTTCDAGSDSLEQHSSTWLRPQLIPPPIWLEARPPLAIPLWLTILPPQPHQHEAALQTKELHPPLPTIIVQGQEFKHKKLRQHQILLL